MNRLSRIAIAAAAALTAVACSDSDGGPASDAAMLTDVVTLEDGGGDGRESVYSFQRYDDSPVITLTDPTTRIDHKYDGSRLLLYYYPESGLPYVSGRVSVRSARLIDTSAITVAPLSDYRWDADGVWLNSIWRTGRWINNRMRLPYTETPFEFRLVADQATADDAEPQLYLVYDRHGAPDNFLREGYASVDISDIWNRPTCRGVRIHVNDLNLKRDIYVFNKQQ